MPHLEYYENLREELSAVANADAHYFYKSGYYSTISGPQGKQNTLPYSTVSQKILDQDKIMLPYYIDPFSRPKNRFLKFYFILKYSIDIEHFDSHNVLQFSYKTFHC